MLLKVLQRLLLTLKTNIWNRMIQIRVWPLLRSRFPAFIDVGLYLNVQAIEIDNILKLRLITDPWHPHPEPTFTFPAEGPRRLRFQMQWFGQNLWIE